MIGLIDHCVCILCLQKSVGSSVEHKIEPVQYLTETYSNEVIVMPATVDQVVPGMGYLM